MCQIWIEFRFGQVIVFRGDESTEKLSPVIQQAGTQQAVTQQASLPSGQQPIEPVTQQASYPSGQLPKREAEISV